MRTYIPTGGVSRISRLHFVPRRGKIVSMVDAVLTDSPAEEWSRLTETASGFSFVQCWEYGEAKARTGSWRVERGAFHVGGRRLGVFQALLRALPLGLPGGLAWVNRGPLATGAEGTGEMTAAMLGALARHYVGERRHYLLVAPPLIDGALAPRGGALGRVPRHRVAWLGVRPYRSDGAAGRSSPRPWQNLARQAQQGRTGSARRRPRVR